MGKEDSPRFLIQVDNARVLCIANHLIILLNLLVQHVTWPAETLLLTGILGMLRWCPESITSAGASSGTSLG